MTLRKVVLAIGCGAFVVADPAVSAELIGKRGGWEIYSADDNCGMSMDFEGPGETNFILVKYVDGGFGSIITNALWSARSGQRYDVEYVVNGFTFKGVGIGSTLSGQSGFVSKFAGDLEPEIARGETLHVYLGEERIDRLSLAGSSAALALVNQCLAGVRARIAAKAREEARWADLPKDPFAPKPANGVTPAVPLGSPGTWATTNDYPSSALREEREGIVGFNVAVGMDGRVQKCSIISSSGHADLDELTCANVTRRARFKPAVDSSNKAAMGEYTGTVRWVLPKN